MTSQASFKKRVLRPPAAEKHVHDWTWRNTGVVFGLSGGIISPLVGSVLTAVSWFTGPHWHGFFLQRDGTVLLVLTIPLLILGAHCLDLLDRSMTDRESIKKYSEQDSARQCTAR